MGPRLLPIIRKYLGLEIARVRRLEAEQSGKPDREAALCLERIEPGYRIRMVLTNKFEPILERNHNRNINPRLWVPSEFVDELFV